MQTKRTYSFLIVKIYGKKVTVDHPDTREGDNGYGRTINSTGGSRKTIVDWGLKLLPWNSSKNSWNPLKKTNKKTSINFICHFPQFMTGILEIQSETVFATNLRPFMVYLLWCLVSHVIWCLMFGKSFYVKYLVMLVPGLISLGKIFFFFF